MRKKHYERPQIEEFLLPVEQGFSGSQVESVLPDEEIYE